MSQKSSAPATRDPAASGKPPAERVMRDFRRVTRKHHSAEDKIRIVLVASTGPRTRTGAMPPRHPRSPPSAPQYGANVESSCARP